MLISSGATLPQADGSDMKSIASSIHDSGSFPWVRQIFATLIRSMLPSPVATPR